MIEHFYDLRDILHIHLKKCYIIDTISKRFTDLTMKFIINEIWKTLFMQTNTIYLSKTFWGYQIIVCIMKFMGHSR